jgi:hypothetical protein
MVANAHRHHHHHCWRDHAQQQRHVAPNSFLSKPLADYVLLSRRRVVVVAVVVAATPMMKTPLPPALGTLLRKSMQIPEIRRLVCQPKKSLFLLTGRSSAEFFCFVA